MKNVAQKLGLKELSSRPTQQEYVQRIQYIRTGLQKDKWTGKLRFMAIKTLNMADFKLRRSQAKHSPIGQMKLPGFLSQQEVVGIREIVNQLNHAIAKIEKKAKKKTVAKPAKKSTKKAA